MTKDRFEPLGRISVTDACRELIRELEEGDGVSFQVAVEEVRARTERPEVELDTVKAGMRLATEQLIDDGAPGVFTVRGSGWQRMKPPDMVKYMRDRGSRAAKQTAREHRAVDAVDVARLGWQDRETVRVVAEARRRVQELAQQRRSRRRPLAPVPDDADRSADTAS